jgi:putative intracellular protease/amidase
MGRLQNKVAIVTAPEVDVVLVPGGSGARREIANPATTNWLRYAAAKCTWLTSVCTGLARERRITTHHDFIHDQRAAGGSDVVEGVRFVRDGNLVTAASCRASRCRFGWWSSSMGWISRRR